MNVPAWAYFYPTQINDLGVIRLPSHRAIQYMNGPWEAERLAAITSVLKPTDVVYDIGAEQGDMTAWFASRVPEGAVVAVEPNPLVWPCIRATFEENGLAEPVATYVGFCASHEELAHPNPAAGWPTCANGTIDPAAGFAHLAEQRDIKRTTVDYLTRTAPPPNVITMDVEGAELQVLKGASRTLVKHRPEVFVSVHPEFMAHHFDQTPQDVHDLMAGHGYTAELLAVDHEHHYWYHP